VSFDAADTVPEVEVSLDDTLSHERFAEIVFRECLAYYQSGVPVLATRRPVGFGRGKL
jgi:hypothetical protein